VWCGIQDFYFEEIRVFQSHSRLQQKVEQLKQRM
jgi:hypothetical protein